MSSPVTKPADSAAFERNLAHFARPRGPNLLARTARLSEWVETRRAANAWPYFRTLQSAPRPIADVEDFSGRTASGINFGSQDYLGLSTEPSVLDAASSAMREFGVHSSGSGAVQGGTRIARELAEGLAELLEVEHALLFPTGWAAGFGSIVGLVRHYDYVVMDNLSHACLQQGAYAATQRVLKHDHLDVGSAREQLQEIRSSDVKGGILVVSEGLFSMDSDTPDIGALQDACREFDATLLLDVAHDLGELGPGGTGALGVQEMLSKVDLVMGSFSKTFASNGGFLATSSGSTLDFVRVYGGPWTFSNALSPVQAAIVLRALEIVRSADGERLRADLLRNVNALRQAFAERGIECLGSPSAIVPVPVGSEKVGRLACSLIYERGVHANLVEFPAVPVGDSRFRMQVMATHHEEQAVQAAEIVASAIAEAKSGFEGSEDGAA
jgi:7-keto-8-aminopelargonate synthetase-like enzyme